MNAGTVCGGVVGLLLLLPACAENRRAPEAPREGSLTRQMAAESSPGPKAPSSGDPSATDGGSGAQKPCKPSGCSGAVCADEPIVTTCIFKPEYACYRTATCERHSQTGKCAWRLSPELEACLKKPPAWGPAEQDAPR